MSRSSGTVSLEPGRRHLVAAHLWQLVWLRAPSSSASSARDIRASQGVGKRARERGKRSLWRRFRDAGVQHRLRAAGTVWILYQLGAIGEILTAHRGKTTEQAADQLAVGNLSRLSSATVWPGELLNLKRFYLARPRPDDTSRTSLGRADTFFGSSFAGTGWVTAQLHWSAIQREPTSPAPSNFERAGRACAHARARVGNLNGRQFVCRFRNGPSHRCSFDLNGDLHASA